MSEAEIVRPPFKAWMEEAIWSIGPDGKPVCIWERTMNMTQTPPGGAPPGLKRFRHHLANQQIAVNNQTGAPVYATMDIEFDAETYQEAFEGLPKLIEKYIKDAQAKLMSAVRQNALAHSVAHPPMIKGLRG